MYSTLKRVLAWFQGLGAPSAVGQLAKNVGQKCTYSAPFPAFGDAATAGLWFDIVELLETVSSIGHKISLVELTRHCGRKCAWHVDR